MESQRISHIHYQVARKSQSHEPKLVNKYVFANAKKIKHRYKTMAKKHRGFGGELKFRASIENRQTKILIIKKNIYKNIWLG